MTRRAIALILMLCTAVLAQTPTGEPKTIAVTVTADTASTNFVVDGKHVDVEQLRAFLRRNGRSNPAMRSTENPRLATTKLVIRFAEKEPFDYIKVVLQLCAEPEIAIYRITLEGKKKTPAWLPVDPPLDGEELHQVHLRIRRVRKDDSATDALMTSYWLGDREIATDENGDPWPVIELALAEHLDGKPLKTTWLQVDAGRKVSTRDVTAAVALGRKLGVKKVVFKGLTRRPIDSAGIDRLRRLLADPATVESDDEPQQAPPLPPAAKSGLERIANVQHDDGTWGEGATRHGVTGVAALAFLGGGSSHSRGDHRPAMRMAMKWLSREAPTEDSTDAGVRRANLQCALAIIESHRLTKSPLFARSSVEAARRIVDACSPTEPWRYAGESSDGATLGWLALFLDAAKGTGVTKDGRRLALLADWFRDNTDAWTGEVNGNADGMMTAAALLTRSLAGHDRASLAPTATHLRTKITKERIATTSPELLYLATAAANAFGGAEWPMWSRAVTAELTREDRLTVLAAGKNRDPLSEALEVLTLELCARN